VQGTKGGSRATPRAAAPVFGCILLLATTSCTSNAPPTGQSSAPRGSAATTEPSTAAGGPTHEPSPTASTGSACGGEAPSDGPAPSQSLTETFPYGSFAAPTTIDNPWLPLTPGTRWEWRGETLEDGEVLRHRVVFVMTDMTKVIDGVETLVGWDRDYSEGVLQEAEIAFAAQDDRCNVWQLGQYPEEYEDGELTGTPAWLAGVDAALAGYWMTGAPGVGKPSYSQGWGPAVGWTDRGIVIEEGLHDCVSVGCFDDVIVIEEWALDEPEAKQLKYYAPDVGNIRVGWSGSADQEQENLELVAFERLTPAQLEAARAEVLALERRAYQNVPHVYGSTAPMQPLD